MDFDEILVKCGNHNRYQYLLLCLYGFILIVTSMHYFSQNVISFVPDHWCYHKQLANKSYAEIENIYRNFEQPSCTRLATIDKNNNSNSSSSSNDSNNNTNNITVSEEKCDRWIYKYDFDYKSMNTELDWVCDSAYKARVGQSFFFVGSMCGTLVFGLLGDKIGRVKSLILANWCGFLGDFSTIFTASITTFSISRFVSGLAADANSYLMYILVLEYISPSLRNVALNTVFGLCYCIGLVSASWLAVLVGNWRLFLLCSSLPLLLVNLFYFVVQESAQWLVTRNDIDGAVKRLTRVAKINRRNVSEYDFDAFRMYCRKNYLKFEEEEANVKNKVKLMDMLKTPRMRKLTIQLLVLFIIIDTCYNTIARNVEGLGISPFIMFTLFALTLPPSGLLQGQLQVRIGRKATLFSSMVVSGLFTVGAGLLLAPSNQPSVIYVVAFILASRFGISVCFGASSQFSTELIPTCVRSRGLAVLHVAGAAASFVSPYIQHMAMYSRAAPSLVLGLLFLAGSYVCLLLPETRNKKLPVTLEDGENFGKDEGMFDFIHQLHKVPNSQKDAVTTNNNTHITEQTHNDDDDDAGDVHETLMSHLTSA